jgi:cytochrome c peroxidase
MKAKLLLAFVAIIAVAQWQLCGCRSNEKTTTSSGEVALRQLYSRKTDSLLLTLDAFANALNKFDYPVGIDSSAEWVNVQSIFEDCRFRYKSMEAMSEYYFQGLIQRINGPALPDVSIQDGQVWPPHGFQVIEQLLYGDNTDSIRTQIVAEIRLLQTDLRFMRANMELNPIRPHHVRELIRHEFIRIATLGITGSDAPLSKLSIEEAVYSLQGIRDITIAYGIKLDDLINRQVGQTIQYLWKHGDFDEFNRLEFLTSYLMPLSDAFEKIPALTESKDSSMSRPFDGSLTQLMKGEGFNPDYYSGYASAKSNAAKIELGRQLFSDARLSGSASISCASCHKPELYFTDGRDKASDFAHGGSLPRNTPTLYYAGLQSAQFYDLRSVSLEDQADQVMSSHREFNSSSTDIATKLWADSAYRALFQKAFGLNEGSLTGYEVRNALAVYVRSLSPFTSSFDDYMRGDKSALTAQQVKGFNLFAGKAKCATCHFVPLFNGTTPPWFTRNESEIIGVPATTNGSVIDPDSGRYLIHRLPALLFAFKTPNLRDVEKTAPYMHNGVFKTLDEVVGFYNKGGGAGLGMKLPTQSLPFDSLKLSGEERKAIVAFLKGLTDRRVSRVSRVSR